MVVDEVHRLGRGVRLEHPRSERALQGQGVGVVGQGRQPGPQRPQLRGGRKSHRRAGFRPAKVLGALHGASTQREAQGRGRQHALVAVPAGRATSQRREDPLGADQVQVGVQQHRPGVAARVGTGPDRGRPGKPSRRRARRRFGAGYCGLVRLGHHRLGRH
ncbi:MAG TPA: hypothetical protein VFE92_16440, partial [Dermatophilaceae bacterium]|nr:hypothetical protein [Dermatophilaceae bacterium]